jgi:hypothetical protein
MEAHEQSRQGWRAAYEASLRRRQSAWLTSQSPHQKRASEILSVFDIEAKNVATSPLATFLLHYICCEALGKLLIGSRENKPPYIIFQRKADGGLEVHLGKLKPAIQQLRISLSDEVLDTVFLSEKKTAGQRSCRVLRNAVVHELHGDYVDEVNRRIAELTEAMTKLIVEVRVRSGGGHIF